MDSPGGNEGLAAPPRPPRFHEESCHRSRRLPAVRDVLYGEILLPGWVRTLLSTRAFRRLADISLSDVPGNLLFNRPFPSRLDHALGVFHLARVARPRDRLLQVAALAHDLGHGPFSHLTEALLREQGDEDHEQRSARFLRDLRHDLSPTGMRQLAWLNWDEAARLIIAGQADGRGELLNGRLDYDNADNVARFLLASGLGRPSYDPATLVRGLRLLPIRTSARLMATGDSAAPAAGRLPPGTPGRLRGEIGRVILLDALLEHARGWQTDRTAVYAYLHEGHTNLALHATLRKAIDLALQARALPDGFLEMTDGEALRLLRSLPQPGIRSLMRAIHPATCYQCAWELELPPGGEALAGRHPLRWRERLKLEERLALEAALAPHEVLVETIVSSAARSLPPLALGGRSSQLALLPAPPAAPARMHLFAPSTIPRDYVRRLCIAAERHFGGMGTVLRSAAG